MLTPDIIEELLAMDEYQSFDLGVEFGPHLAISCRIRDESSVLIGPSGEVQISTWR
jgi:tyrosinase